MPVISIDAQRDIPGGTSATSIDITAQVYRNGAPAIRVSNDEILIPSKLVSEVTGAGSIDLADIPVDCYWKLDISADRDISQRLYVTLPVGAGPFDFDELVIVDPSTGIPDPGSSMAEAFLAQIEAVREDMIADAELTDGDLIFTRYSGEQINLGNVSSGGLGSLRHTHDQGVANTTWTITHALPYYPNVTVVDSAGTKVEGDIQYVNSTTIQLTFSGAFSGKAYLS